MEAENLLGRESRYQVEISEFFLAELLSMARKPASRDSKRCKNCTKQKEPGRRGLCAEHWKIFDCERRKARRQIIKTTKLTTREVKQGLTLEEKQEQELEKWDAVQVKMGLIEASHKGPRSDKKSPFVRIA